MPLADNERTFPKGLPSDWTTRMNIQRQSGSLLMKDGDVIEDASGDDRIKFTDSGATIIYDEAGNASLTVNTDQSTTFASHITGSGNLEITGNISGSSTSRLVIGSHITGSGNLEIAGNISASSTSTGSFGRINFANTDYLTVFSGSVTQTGSIGHIIASNNSIQFGTGADAETMNKDSVKNMRLGKRSKALTIPTFPNDDVTPSVANGAVFKTATGGSSVTITDFDNGQTGEVITVICSNTATRFDDGSGLENAGAAQLRCGTNDTFQWVYDGTNWFNIGTSDNS